MRDDSNKLRFEILKNSSLDIQIGGKSYEKAKFEPLLYYLMTSLITQTLRHCVLENKIINLRYTNHKV